MGYIEQQKNTPSDNLFKYLSDKLGLLGKSIVSKATEGAQVGADNRTLVVLGIVGASIAGALIYLAQKK